MKRNRRRILAFLMGIMLILPAIVPLATPASAIDVEYIPLTVPNGGFEEPVTTGGVIPGWTTTPAASAFDGTLVAEASSERVSSGTNSLKMVDHDPVRSLEVFSSRIPITEEQTYRARAQVYVEAKSVRVYVRFLKSGSSVDLSNGSFNFLANTVGSWNTVEIEAYSPKGADQAQITFYYGGSGTGTISYIDDVRFDRKKEAGSTFQPPYGPTGIDLGEPVKIGLSQAAAIGIGPDGTLEQYITSVASPSAFTVVDALTGISKFSERVPGATDPIWGIARGADGNYYFTSTGKLYRYLAAERRIENLGTNPTGNSTMWDVKASSDGKIYGSTSHTGNMGKVFEYDIATSTFKDLGVVKDGETSARGLGVTDRYLYVGTGTKAGLVRIDRQTGEKVDLDIPGVTGRNGATLTEVAVYNGLVFVNSGTELFVLRDGTYEYVRTIPYQSKISPPSPVDPDLMYYKVGEEFFSYNMATDTIAKMAAIRQPLPDSAFKFSEWVIPASGPFAGKSVLFSMAAFGEAFLFEPEQEQYSTVLARLDVNAAQINALEYNNGKLFASGFQRGMSIYDIASGRIVYDFPTFHQSESIGFNGEVVYFGTYTGAKMYRMDLSEPIQYNDYGWGNPGIAWDIGDDQNRPFAFASGGGNMFVGTFPASGFQGALTVMQEKRDDRGQVTGITSETFRNIMKDQSIIGLDYKDGKVYGSTTVYSGSGSVNPAPLEKEAKVFIFNPDTHQIERTVTPKVPDVTGEVKIIGGLSVGPDGLIWGIQDAFVNTTIGYDASIFALDPVTLEVVKAKKITQSPYSTSKYRPYYIRWGNDGLLYTTIGRKLFAIDPVTLSAKDLLPGKAVNLMTMADNGDIYYTDNTKLLKLPIAIDVSKPSLSHSRLTPGHTTRVSGAYKLVDRSQTDPAATTVSYVSSNPSVLTITGDQATAVGKGTVSVRAVVRSGGITVTGPALEVEVLGSEPSISALSDLTLDEDTISDLIPFRVEDYDTPTGSLTVTAVSSNEALIPAANIRLGGSGYDRTLQMMPAVNQYGFSSVQLTVTDGTYSASTSFTVHVLAVNDAPTLSPIADQTAAPGKRTIEIPFTIGDVDTPLSRLTVTASSSDTTVVPQPGLVIIGSEAARIVRITTEPGRPRSSTRITLTVSDSVDSTTRSFNLTVTPDGGKQS